MATRTIKTKLELSGDQEYKDKLKQVNAELSEQKSKLKLLTVEMGNNQNSCDALKRKVEQLREVQQAQQKVVEASREGLKNALRQQERYAAEVGELQKKLEAAQVGLENLNQETVEGRKRQEELTAEIDEYRKQLEKANENQKLAAAGVDAWTEKQSRANTALNRLNAQIKQQEGYLEEAKKSADGCATSIDQYGKKVKEASEEEKEFDDRLDSTEAAVGSLAAAIGAGGLTKAVAGIKDAIIDCIGAAAMFETALAKVSTIADTEAVSMDEIRREILELSNDTGQAVDALSEASYNAISAGVKTAGAVDFVATATKLATGGFTENTTAVDILTTALNAYGLELDQAQKVADYLITTQNLGKTTVDELAASYGKVIPVAAAYNVEMDNLSSAVAVLTANGISTAESITYLKAVLNELGDSESAVSGVLAEQTGKSFSMLMERGKSLGDVMEILGSAVRYDKGAFNELWSSTEAGIAALSLLSAGSEKYNSVLGEMRNSAGATERAYAKMADTTEMSQRKLSNAFNNLKVAVGGELQEQMGAINEKGADMIAWATKFVQENKWVAPVLEGVALSLGVLTVEITGVTVATKVLIPIWQAFTASLAAHPVAVVATAVLGLTAAIAPLAASMERTKSETEEQAAAWRENARALQECTSAYREQDDGIRETVKDTKELVGRLRELASKEGKTAEEKKELALIVDELNEKLPELGLHYDEVSGSVNKTTEEVEKLSDELERQERNANAKSHYLDALDQRRQVVEEMNAARQTLAEVKKAYDAEVQKLGEQGDKLEVKNLFFQKIDTSGVELSLYRRELLQCATAYGSQQRALRAADAELQQMRYDMDLYTIQMADMTDEERKSIEKRLEGTEKIRRANAEAYYEEVSAIAAAAQEYDDYANFVKNHAEDVMQQVQEIQDRYEENYQAAHGAITKKFDAFAEIEKEQSISVKKMINNMKAQESYMQSYAENIRKAMELGLDEGMIKQLSDGSEKSAAMLQQIVGSGEKNIKKLNEEFAKVQEGKEEFSRAVAEMETYYGEEMDKLVEETANAIQEMAKYDEAYQSAWDTCAGLLEGVDSQWNAVISKYEALGKAAMNAYNKGISGQSAGDEYLQKKEEADVVGKMAAGLDSGMTAVVREIRASVPSAGKREGHKTLNQTFNIYTPTKSPSEIMRAARLEQTY